MAGNTRSSFLVLFILVAQLTWAASNGDAESAGQESSLRRSRVSPFFRSVPRFVRAGGDVVVVPAAEEPAAAAPSLGSVLMRTIWPSLMKGRRADDGGAASSTTTTTTTTPSSSSVRVVLLGGGGGDPGRAETAATGNGDKGVGGGEVAAYDVAGRRPNNPKSTFEVSSSGVPRDGRFESSSETDDSSQNGPSPHRRPGVPGEGRQYRRERRLPNGVVFGRFGYVDGDGKTQETHYVSDAWGYRIVTPDANVTVYPDPGTAAMTAAATAAAAGVDDGSNNGGDGGPVAMKLTSPSSSDGSAGPKKDVTGASVGPDDGDGQQQPHRQQQIQKRNKNGIVILYTAEMSDPEKRKRVDDLLLAGPVNKNTIPLGSAGSAAAAAAVYSAPSVTSSTTTTTTTAPASTSTSTSTSGEEADVGSAPVSLSSPSPSTVLLPPAAPADSFPGSGAGDGAPTSFSTFLTPSGEITGVPQPFDPFGSVFRDEPELFGALTPPKSLTPSSREEQRVGNDDDDDGLTPFEISALNDNGGGDSERLAPAASASAPTVVGGSSSGARIGSRISDFPPISKRPFLGNSALGETRRRGAATIFKITTESAISPGEAAQQAATAPTTIADNLTAPAPGDATYSALKNKWPSPTPQLASNSNHYTQKYEPQVTSTVDPDDLWYHGNLDPHLPEKKPDDPYQIKPSAPNGPYHHQHGSSNKGNYHQVASNQGSYAPPHENYDHGPPHHMHGDHHPAHGDHHHAHGEHHHQEMQLYDNPHHHHHHHHKPEIQQQQQQTKPGSVFNFPRPEYKPIPKPGSPDDPHIQMLLLNNQVPAGQHNPLKPSYPPMMSAVIPPSSGSNHNHIYGQKPSSGATPGSSGSSSVGGVANYPVPPVQSGHHDHHYQQPKPPHQLNPYQPFPSSIVPYPVSSTHHQSSSYPWSYPSSQNLVPWNVGSVGSLLPFHHPATITYTPGFVGHWGSASSGSTNQATLGQGAWGSLGATIGGGGPWTYWRSADSKPSRSDSGPGSKSSYAAPSASPGFGTQSRSKMAAHIYSSAPTASESYHGVSGAGASGYLPYHQQYHSPLSGSSSTSWNGLYLPTSGLGSGASSHSRIRSFAPVFETQHHQLNSPLWNRNPFDGNYWHQNPSSLFGRFYYQRMLKAKPENQGSHFFLEEIDKTPDSSSAEFGHEDVHGRSKATSSGAEQGLEVAFRASGNAGIKGDASPVYLGRFPDPELKFPAAGDSSSSNARKIDDHSSGGSSSSEEA